MTILVENYFERFGPFARPYCCAIPPEIVIVITSNRMKQYRLRCPVHGKIANHNLAYNKLHNYEKAEAEIARVNTPSDSGICEHCGAIGPVHGHHTAPRQYFEDADSWPVVDLCQKCHTEWHQKIRKPTHDQ